MKPQTWTLKQPETSSIVTSASATESAEYHHEKFDPIEKCTQTEPIEMEWFNGEFVEIKKRTIARLLADLNLFLDDEHIIVKAFVKMNYNDLSTRFSGSKLLFVDTIHALVEERVKTVSDLFAYMRKHATETQIMALDIVETALYCSEGGSIIEKIFSKSPVSTDMGFLYAFCMALYSFAVNESNPTNIVKMTLPINNRLVTELSACLAGSAYANL